ncbi:AMP-binding protein [Aldersonia kunmingensis]|uniref:AMP-binding protein n=1 Tax=Aldersonia kunmingensis TaxID=408066 RepID=UPI000831CCE3|nr:AMP-binding protein [Aldersonia kunmingensis]
MLTTVKSPISPFIQQSPEPLRAAVDADPNVIAVESSEAQLSYADLDGWSNRLARVLINMGAGPGANIVMSMPPAVESVVTMWAAAKAGAALASVDAEAAEAVIEDSEVVVGVTTRARRKQLPDSITWLVLDDAATLVRYMTVADTPLTAAG